jgi:hypothetical protein
VAFLVGVGKYDHNFTDLGTAPENDVGELAKELAGGGFEVEVLTGRKPDGDPRRATRANIEGRFKELLAGGGRPALRGGDTLVVVLCGHGVQAAAPDPAAGKPTDQPLFCPVDARPNDTATMVPLNALIREAEAFGCTALFLVDACREVPPDPNRGTRTGIQGKKVNLPAKTAILFACGQGQLSHQSEKLGRGHGLFTFAVLKTLRAGGRVTWSRLVAGVEEAFESDELRALIPAGGSQSPVEAKGELGTTELLAARPGGVRAAAKPDPPKKAEDTRKVDAKGAARVRIKTSTPAYLRADSDDPDRQIGNLEVGTEATIVKTDDENERYLLKFADGKAAWVRMDCCTQLDK